jgi:predicted dehydrogenase
VEEERGSIALDREPAGDAGARTRPPVRAGIVGAGFIGAVHARAARLAGARVTAVAASTPARGEQARAQLRAERAYATAEELVASDDVDVVHVCAPNHLHVPLASAAIAAGKHLICEKPLAFDSAGAAELTAAASAAGKVATVPFVYRYYPTVREARARARTGALGELRLLHGGYLQDWLLGADDDNWRVDPELGGPSRAFADIGSHWCDLVEFVSGQRIVALCARTAVAHAERRRSQAHSFARAEADGGEDATRAVETEDIAALMFETDGGVIGSTVISQVSAGRKNQLWFELSGSEQAVCFDQERPETLWVGRRSGTERIPRDFDTLAPEAAAYVTLPGGHPQGYQDCFDAFVAETYAAIDGEAAADGLPGLADGARAVAITEAVLESARSREWVEVPAPAPTSGRSEAAPRGEV